MVTNIHKKIQLKQIVNKLNENAIRSITSLILRPDLCELLDSLGTIH